MFDYFFQKTGGVWAPWEDLLDRNASIPAGAKVTELIIPTVDTARQTYFLDALTRHGVPLLLVGPTGTGKSAITNSYLVKLPKDRLAFILQLQRPLLVVNVCLQLPSKCCQLLCSNNSQPDPRHHNEQTGPQEEGSVWSSNGQEVSTKPKPLGGEDKLCFLYCRCLVFVDDLNMPQKEKYGAQPPIELLRQWVDHKHWYDKKDNSRLELADVVGTPRVWLIPLSSLSLFLRTWCVQWVLREAAGIQSPIVSPATSTSSRSSHLTTLQ